MVDEHKTNKNLIRRLSLLFFAALTGATSLLVFLAIQGYDLNRDGSLIRNGILIAESTLPGSRLVVDQKVDEGTPAQVSLPEGSYNIKLMQEGYRTWSRNVDIDASNITWINYPLLIPDKTEFNLDQKIENVHLAHKMNNSILIASDDQELKPNILTLTNIDASKPADMKFDSQRSDYILDVDFTASEIELSGGITVEVVNSSKNKRFVLLKIEQSGGTSELLLIDTKDKLSNETKSVFKKTQISNADDIFISDSGETMVIERKELITNVISGVLTTKPTNISVKDESTFVDFISDSELIASDGEEASRFSIDTTLKPIEKSNYLQTPMPITGTHSYKDKLYLLSGDGKECTIFDSTNIVEEKYKLTSEFQSCDVFQKKPSPSGRFLFIKSNAAMHVYDFQFDAAYSFASFGENAYWLDEHRTISVKGLSHTMHDFSGDNQIVFNDSSGLLHAKDDGFLYSYKLDKKILRIDALPLVADDLQDI